MSNPSALGALCYATETNFGEDVTTFGALRIAITTPVDASGLKHPKQDSKRVVQLRNDGTQWILMPMSGQFKTVLYLPGHGSTTSGATSIGLHEQLFGYILGNVAVSAAAGTTFTGGTASVPTTTASGTFTAGSLCRAGSINDTRGNGQWFAIHDHTAANLTLLNAMDNAPNNGDVLYSAVNIYPSETPTSVSVQSLRFLLQTANLCYEAHGCYPSAIAFKGLGPGLIPMMEVTWEVAWWRYSTATFPSVVATEIFQPQPNAAGSVILQPFATVSPRTKFSARDFSINYKLGMAKLEGPGGFNQYQACIGVRRIPDVIDVKFTIDADAQTATPVLDSLATGTVGQQLLASMNPIAGQALAFYFPNLMVSARPTQRIDKNVNRYDFSGRAACSTTLTSDLTESAFRMAFA